MLNTETVLTVLLSFGFFCVMRPAAPANRRAIVIARRCPATVCAVVGSLASMAASAGAYGPDGVAVDQGHVYWANDGTDSIGRANLDGTDVDQTFIAVTGDPRGVAVDESHVYWVNNEQGSIGRANLDGTDVDQTFVTGIMDGRGMAVSSSGIYWANNSDSASTIGRANLDGSGVNQSLVADIPPVGGGPEGVAVDEDHIYWGSFYASIFDHYGQIGDADLDGSDVDNYLTRSSGYAPEWVTVFGGYLYWSNYDDGNIGRADLDGRNIDWDYIQAGSAIGLAVDGNHVYWANSETGTIGRANADGSAIDQDFITGIDPPPPFPSPPAVTPAPALPYCYVPNLIHTSLAAAKQILAGAGCRLGKVARPRHHYHHQLLVVRQEPRYGTQLPARARVNIRLSAHHAT